MKLEIGYWIHLIADVPKYYGNHLWPVPLASLDVVSLAFSGYVVDSEWARIGSCCVVLWAVIHEHLQEFEVLDTDIRIAEHL